MRIYVDADAYPKVIKDILVRASKRVHVPLILVANQEIQFPRSKHISSLVVSGDFNAADDRIVSLVEEGDLVITADIPLADRVVTKGGYAINPRGELYTKENIKERLAMRDLMDELRSAGIQSGFISAFTQKDREAFANQLDRFLTKFCKNGNPNVH